MPTSREAPFIGVIGTKIYVVGGGTSSAVLNVNEIYDTTTNTWSTGAPLPTARWAGASAVINNILYAVGGANASGSVAFNVVEAYDPSTNKWSTKSSMPIVNDSIVGTAYDGLLYTFGGFQPGTGRIATVLSYNPGTDTWTTLAPLKVGKSQPAVGVVGSVIVATGGLASSGVTTDNEAYNVASNAWMTVAAMPTARNSGCYEAFGSVLYVAGGNAVGNTTQLFSMDSYDASADKWTTGQPTMPHGVVNPGSASAGGRLYCFGGSNQGNPLQGSVFNYTQIYQPAIAAPAISPGGVVSASAFGGFPSVSPGSWIEIYGSSLGIDTRGWGSADFNGTNAPTSLDGTSVTIGGQSAFVDYISPGQVNALVPANVTTGTQPIIVANAAGKSPPFNVTVNAVQPGLLAPAAFSIGGVPYAAAFFADGSYVLPVGAIAGLSSRPAKPGDTIIFYGVGFGPVTPSLQAGQLVQLANSLASGFQMSIGGIAAPVLYAGLAPGYTGLYQFNVTVPNAAAGNAVPVTFTLAGANSTQTINIAVSN